MFVIMLVIGFIFMVFSIHLDVRKKKGASLAGIFAGMAYGIGVFGIADSITPTALDVYQGKTTLETTYKDGVAIDSVVVFKDKKK